MALCNEKLKKLRTDLGRINNEKITQPFVYSKTGVHKDNISKYENGTDINRQFTKDLNDADKLAEFYGVDLEYLFDDSIPTIDLEELLKKYPYKTLKQKIMDLEKDLASFSNCDEDFKKEVSKIKKDYDKANTKLHEIFNIQVEDDDLRNKVIEIKKSLIYSINDNLKITYELNKKLDDIKTFIIKKDGKRLFQASMSIFNFKNYIIDFEKGIDAVNDFYNEMIDASNKYENAYLEVTDIQDKTYDILDKLYECDVKESDNKQKYGLMKSMPTIEINEIYAFWVINHYRSFEYYLNKTLGISIKSKYIDSVFKELAYEKDDENKDVFKLENIPNTLEKLYNYSCKFVFEKIDFEQEIKEYIENATNWINLSLKQLEKWEK